ncbi:hypothetical protein FRC07_003649 [Ceratobasidium sp. 392]|nr:hypothetical protein FRC07_003649 [Ceratobasidium sp. 392]
MLRVNTFKYPPKNSPGISSHVVYSNLTLPRGIRFDDKDNLVAIERGIGVTSLTSRNDAACRGWERRVVVNNVDLNHAVEFGPGPKRGRVQNTIPQAGPAQIRRFNPSETVPAGGRLWQQGKFLGWGIRNGVGIRISKDGNSVWEVDNGPDNAFCWGVDVHNDDPAEESSKLALPNTLN